MAHNNHPFPAILEFAAFEPLAHALVYGASDMSTFQRQKERGLWNDPRAKEAINAGAWLLDFRQVDLLSPWGIYLAPQRVLHQFRKQR
jgi:hypothetical protein